MTTSTENSDKNAKLKQAVQILQFILTVDDKEIIQSSIEAVIEMLEEEID